MKIAIIAAALIAVVTGASYALDDGVYEKVKSGEYKLFCDTGKGMKLVDPEKITGRMDGTWLFVENGYANACRVDKGEALQSIAN